MQKYLKVWFLLTSASFKVFFASRVGAVLFLLGKILRFVFFLGFLIVLVSRVKILAGYTFWQVILFYLTFNFIDATTQMLFREVYRFREQIVRGNFDLILVKPVNPLFKILFGGTDLLDFLTLFPFLVFIAIAIAQVPDVHLFGIIFYLLLVLNALWIAASFHIMVLAQAILTTEVDHAIMIYRDVAGMGKFPIDIYREPLRSFITFAIPVGVMMTYPVKSLFGILSIGGVLVSFLVTFSLFAFSLILWNYALKKYTSVSS